MRECKFLDKWGMEEYNILRVCCAAARESVRKVRASQSRITDNIGRGRPPDKCNRDKPPHISAVRVERWGKSPPVDLVTGPSCKLYPKQHRLGGYGLLGQSPDRWLEAGSNVRPR